MSVLPPSGAREGRFPVPAGDLGLPQHRRNYPFNLLIEGFLVISSSLPATVGSGEGTMITDRQCRAGHAKPQREAGLTREPERPMAERTRALSTGETQLHRILDRIADMVVTIDDEGRIESFNQAAETAFGYCAAEIVGREASMLLAERDRGRHDKQLRRRGAADADGMRSSPTDGVEALRRNGSAFPIELDIDEMELNGRRLFVAILRDVSERRRIEDEMRRSAQQLSLIANALPVLIAYLDADLCYRYVNKTFADWWQIPVHQAVGRSIAEALGLEAFEAIRPYFEAVLRGETLTFDREILHPDGRKRLCHAYYAPHFDEARRILGIVTLVEDVTERRRSEQALRESQHSLANAQRIAHIGNWDWDVATGKVGWSEEVFRIFGFEVGAFQPSYDTFHHLIHPDDRDTITAAASKSRRDERHYQVDYRIIRPDGGQRIVHEEGEITRNEAGLPIYMAGTVQDVTERRAMEAQLQQAQKMEAVGQLTGGIAHDFNNLLGVIIGNLDLLENRSEARPDDQGLIRRAIEAAERGASLTHHLLAFSRRQTLQPRRIDVNSLVGDMSELLKRTLGETVDVRIVLGDAIWSINVDRVQLESAILNLAINARDAMGDGGRLTIATASQTFEEADIPADGAIRPGDYVIISVSDNGAGMNPDILAHVFEPFFTTKEIGKGTGLGLSMVYGFVKQSGGHVTIYSESGHGTTVKLYLPRMPGAPEIATPKTVAPIASGKGHHVLVVEDNPALLEFSQNALVRLGYETIPARTAAEALRWLSSEERIDVLFTDIILGAGMSGFDVAREAQRLRPGLRVLFTSGFVEHDLIAAEGDGPGIELLTKPFRTADLGRRLAGILTSPPPCPGEGGE
jgi:PAS domain S-box-containing protein